MKQPVLFLVILCLSIKAYCCDCDPVYEIRGFCQTLKEAKNNPMFCVVKARVVSYHHWGINIEVLENIYNTAKDNNIIVWGDNGASCRRILTATAGIQTGDTFIMALQQTDLMGNILTPGMPDYEDSSDYMLHGCGTYLLRYRNGIIPGGFYRGNDSSAITYTELKNKIADCLEVTGINEAKNRNSEISVSPNPCTSNIGVHAVANIDELAVYNGMGATVIKLQPGSLTANLDLRSLPNGIYMLAVYTHNRQEVSYHKIVKQQ